MKSEKGITLISLIIYVIVMLITITVISVMTSYYYNNIQISTDKYTSLGEYTKFNSYFSEEVNKENNKILELGTVNDGQQNYIVFSSNNQYTFIPENKAIYQNNVKITSGVDNCQFYNKIVNGKEAVVVKIIIQDMEKTVEYVLK